MLKRKLSIFQLSFLFQFIGIKEMTMLLLIKIYHRMWEQT